MPDNSRGQADLAGAEVPSKSADSAASALPTASLQDVTEIAQKLAAHGGGSASLDLAFDLVLHEIVDLARTASGATGAAIALTRDGKMVCRATSGENAPDLGVSVEAASGLTGACLKTEEVQHCQDTEKDPRVDPETCRRLGVRSMLIVPLIEVDGTFGILQVFSVVPNAFGEPEMTRLLRLADRVGENRRAMLRNISPSPRPSGLELSMPDRLNPKLSNRGAIANDDAFQLEPAIPYTNEIWTAILFFLVILTAISLGIVVGWSNGRKRTIALRVSPQSNAAVPGRAQAPTKPSAQDAGTDPTSSVDPSSKIHNEAKSVDVAAGGLVVTESGKVIYRSPEQPRKPYASKPGTRELIHRVEPKYPPDARAQHIEGMVTLDLEIAPDGSITDAAVVSGDPRLASAAVQAVRQWLYQPDPGGASRTRVTLQFTLPVN